MKKILITNHFLKDFTGSEIATLDLAKEFLVKGYDVTIGTFTYADPLKIEFEKLNIRVIDLNVAEAEFFDLIWAHHFTTLDTCLLDVDITADKIIFSSLSPYESLESLPLMASRVNLFLANSLETKKVLDEIGAKNIEIFQNPVSNDFFLNDTKKYLGLRSIAIVSNHIPNEVKDAVELLKHNGIEVKIFGIEGEFKLITPDILIHFDAVITIGRTVQYCLAMGIPVYCYDRFGGPGWINESNIDLASDYNFSGRCTQTNKLAKEIVDEIVSGFSSVFEQIENYRKYALAKNNLTVEVDKVLELLKQSKGPKKDKLAFENIALRQRKYFKSIEGSQQYFIQLFIDSGVGISEETSIRLFLSKNIQTQVFSFELSNCTVLKNLRLDPLNDFCHIHIQRIALVTEEEEINLLPLVTSSSCMTSDKYLLFDTSDPQIYFKDFEVLDISLPQRLIVEIEYLEIGTSALRLCMDQVLASKDTDMAQAHQRVLELKAIVGENASLSQELLIQLNTTQQEMRELERVWNDKLLEANRLFEAKREGFEEESQLLQKAIEQAQIDKTVLIMDMTEKERIRTQEQGERERELRERLITTQQEMRELERVWNDKLLEANRLFEAKRQGFEEQSQMLQKAIEQVQIDKIVLIMDMTEKERIRTEEQGERERELNNRLITTQNEMLKLDRVLNNKIDDCEKLYRATTNELDSIKDTFIWHIILVIGNFKRLFKGIK